MSKYTTGEMAKLCGVSVRTVQYYDSRNLLVPSAFSEGGRRLYSEEDLKRLRIICFLRELDLSINAIAQLLAEEHPEEVLELLLQQQEKELRREIGEQQTKLDKLEQLRREVGHLKHFSVDSIADIAHVMKTKKQLRKIRTIMLAAGIVLEILETGGLILWIATGIWWPYALGLLAVIVGSVWMMSFYHKYVSYICPKCHTVFKPSLGRMFWAVHTPNTRKLTCTACGHKGFCVEVSGEDPE